MLLADQSAKRLPTSPVSPLPLPGVPEMPLAALSALGEWKVGWCDGRRLSRCRCVVEKETIDSEKKKSGAGVADRAVSNDVRQAQYRSRS